MVSDVNSKGYNLEELLRCPTCRGGLHSNGDGNTLICGSCSAEWPIQAGIPVFLPGEALPDCHLAEDESAMVEIARDEGWLVALERHHSRTGVRREHTRQYIASEARADFRFMMSLDEDATVLDVGSSWGNLPVAFARNSRLVFALDTTFSNAQFVEIRADQEGLNNVLPILGDATRLPLPPASCDCVLMVGVLDRVPGGRNDGTPQDLQVKALAEAHHVLKPGGQLYIGTQNRFSFKNLLGAREPLTGLRFISILPRVLANYYSLKSRGMPFREWTHSQRNLRRLLRRAGFRDADFYYPIPSYENIRYITDYSTPRLSRFLVSRFEGHGSFSEGLRIASLVAALLRMEKRVSPCFSVLAEKSHD